MLQDLPAPRPPRRATRRPISSAFRFCVRRLPWPDPLPAAVPARDASRPPGCCWSPTRLGARPDRLRRLVSDSGGCRFLAKESVSPGFAGTILRAAGQIPAPGAPAPRTPPFAPPRPAGRRRAHRHLPRGLRHPRPRQWPMPARTGVARLALPSGAPSSRSPSGAPQLVHDSYRQGLPPAAAAPADYLSGAGRPPPPASPSGQGSRSPASCCTRPPTC